MGSRFLRRVFNVATQLGAARTYCSHVRHAFSDSSSSLAMSKRLLLPQNVKPVHYNLRMQPDLEKYTYTGSVAIDLEVKENTKSISLNTLDLELTNITLSNNDQFKSQSYDSDSETSTFLFENGVKAGEKVTLSIDFSGELNDKLCGFYRSVHTDDSGKKRVVATTQMEPTDARRAFPCFDEPALKATYDITLVHDKAMVALSNASEKETSQLGNGLQQTVFNTTPAMSTYLVAFIVGEMNYVECNDFRVPVRVYTTPGMEERGRYGAELTAKTLAFYEEKFDVDYKLDKMDLVAIHDFSAGAMENWGLITYRVVDLLFDEATDSAATKARVAEVLLHEAAHQWFGNLVTMDWWDGLWLNEGFATWMSWYACNHFYPEWRVWETYVTDTLQSSLRLDGLRSSHPIEVPIERADQVNQIFDSISYAKGSSVIKMIANWLGEEKFIEGISVYLKRHAFGNTRTEDLWQALSEVSGQNVTGVMGPWTKEQGYPVLTVSESGDQITVKQNRFLTTGDVKAEDDKCLYPVNLAVKTRDGVDDVMLTTRETTFTTNQDFYKLNAEQTGIYRVLYPMDRIEKLSEAGAEQLLSPEDRIGLVSDVGSLGASGYQRTSALLELSSKWKVETEANVWSEMTSHLGSLRSVFKTQPDNVQDALKKFQADLVREKAKEVGHVFTQQDGLLDQQLKALLYGAAAGAEIPEYKQDALDLFEQYMAGDQNAINPNLRGTVFGTAAKFGDASVYDKLMSIYTSPKSSSEGNTALRCIGRCKLPEVREKLLNAALKGPVRSQDVFFALGPLNIDKEGSDMLWNWFKHNFDDIHKLFPPSTGMFSHIVEICAGGFSTKDAIADIDAFFADKNTKGYDKSISIVKDRIQSRVSWLERDVEDVTNWLTQKGYL